MIENLELPRGFPDLIECNHCGETKPLAEYRQIRKHRRKHGLRELDPICLSCDALRQRRYRRKQAKSKLELMLQQQAPILAAQKLLEQRPDLVVPLLATRFRPQFTKLLDQEREAILRKRGHVMASNQRMFGRYGFDQLEREYGINVAATNKESHERQSA